LRRKPYPAQVRAEDVRLPEGAMFVIANSLTVSKKAESADYEYNMRVTECRLAAVLLALACGAPAVRAPRQRPPRALFAALRSLQGSASALLLPLSSESGGAGCAHPGSLCLSKGLQT